MSARLTSKRDSGGLAPGGQVSAVIDIGSNSVRLVVFDGPPRAPLPKFNEKATCGLGQGIAETGALKAESIEAAITTLKRFSKLLALMGVERVRVVATAAVREASNGDEFVRRVRRECHFDVQVLSGREEARYAAYGVMAGTPHADGIVGDLGGGSLELVNVSRARLGRSATLPLGALRLYSSGLKGAALEDEIDRRFATLPWLAGGKGRPIYVVGGAWRAIARIHMAQEDYPLRVIHNYRLPQAEAIEVCRLLARQSTESLAGLSAIPSKRLMTLQVAATLMGRLLAVTGASGVDFMSYGLREGLLYGELNPAERRRDPLIDACRDMAAREGRFREHGNELRRWLMPLFPDADKSLQRLILAAALLGDIAWRVNSDYRAGQAFRRIIRAPFGGIDHRGRAIIALAVYARYRNSLDGDSAASGRALLSSEDRRTALVIGLGLGLAHKISGGTLGVLDKVSLSLDKNAVALEVMPDFQPLLGDHVERRLAQLAQALDREAQLRLPA
ncbi:Ppx/GppA family phosphatase [Oceanibacterium hippocampi]|uniref:Guanosine-5'-triphosphate,3'-diphosphate pyrophosphatase n=1 Tax=Oceanibacterium hippocampi TaxID=745714 RepID=A0A1Y5SWW4_9PROT|nr:Ppx/GppA family phosphatase [Oceanibacterium hippocampi]SLN48760.1 Guanosine-5'-triphosphate,3'-diphosphate pyrophosphatase [Oceanibacterium hippocampi]